jgi:hypothetical protein
VTVTHGMNDDAWARQARQIIDDNLYMVLGTADADGRPWASPVYFAPDGYFHFFWVSSPEATHSRNITARREVGLVIFDSRVPIGTGQGVYMTADAGQAAGPALERGIEVFSQRSVAHGGKPFSLSDVQGEAGIRLYHAVSEGHSMLAKDGQPDHRIGVNLGSP